MLGFSICNLLMRSLMSLARSTLFPDITFDCGSVRRFGTAPGFISGQSRPAAWPRAGTQMDRPLSRSANATRFHRRAKAGDGNKSSNFAASVAAHDIWHLQTTLFQKLIG